MLGAAAAHGIPTASLEISVQGQPAHLLISAYANRLMIIVTGATLSSLGTILQAEKEGVLGSGTTYRVETLLGRRDDETLELCARQLAEGLAAGGWDRSLVLCLGVRQLTPAGVRDIVTCVIQHTLPLIRGTS